MAGAGVVQVSARSLTVAFRALMRFFLPGIHPGFAGGGAEEQRYSGSGGQSAAAAAAAGGSSSTRQQHVKAIITTTTTTLSVERYMYLSIHFPFYTSATSTSY
jgi:hypothetical protein